ncbi:hypothetical protein CDAR_608261 [Caerostris darwini]|uniref:POGZ/Z280C-D-like double Zinc finger domain-containing protein n=1 Tax=Caerostris darwini TaxID=1538125 RepID=A0AAV4UHL1_9ARAC|nr:hypothetical protein CDAR_608261 [Caerostris darwini]
MNRKGSETSNLENYCCISQCRNYKNPGIDLYPLPDDYIQRSKCCEILGIPHDVGMLPKARVCALHFKSKLANMQYYFIDENRRLVFRPNIPRPQSPRSTEISQQDVLSKETHMDIKENNDDEDDSTCKTIYSEESPDVTLELVCEDDGLSDAQRTSYMKDLVDFVTANEIVYNLPPPEPRSVNSTIIPAKTEANNAITPTIEQKSSLVTSAPLSNSQFIQISSPISNPSNGSNILPNSVSTLSISNMNNLSLGSNAVNVIAPSMLPSQIPPISSSVNVGTRTVTTGNDKIPAFININPTQMGNCVTTSSSNFLGPQIILNNSSVPGSIFPSTPLNTVIPISTPPAALPSFPIAPRVNQFASTNFVNSLTTPNYSYLSTNPLGIPQINPVGTMPAAGSFCGQPIQILSDSFNILAAVKNNTVIPVLLHRAPSVNSPNASLVDHSKESFGNSMQPILKNTEPSPTVVNNKQDSEMDWIANLSNVSAVYDSPRSNEPTDESSNSNQSTSSNVDKSKLIIKIDEVMTKKNSTNKEVNNFPLFLKHLTPSLPSSNSEDSTGPIIVDVRSAKEGNKQFFTVPNEKDDPKELLLYSSANAEEIHLDQIFTLQKFSIFSLQDPIPIIPSGPQHLTEPIHLFKLKMPELPKKQEQADRLRESLRRDNCILWPIWWLVYRRDIPLRGPCHFCGCSKFVIDMNNSFPDGFGWTCARKTCPNKEPIMRPTFFDRFKSVSLRDLLLLTYHWACQSSIEEIVQDVNLECEKIWDYFKALKEICRDASLKKGKLGTQPGSLVEVAVMKMGNFFILGALDRKTRYVRLEALAESDASNSLRHLSFLAKWVDKKAVIVSEKKIDKMLLPDIETVAADPTVKEKLSLNPHILNIKAFFLKNLHEIFGMVNHKTLTLSVIQGLLCELEWRVKYGKSIHTTFYSILNHIRELNKEKGYPESKITVIQGKYKNDLRASNLPSFLFNRWGPHDLQTIVSSSLPLDMSKNMKTYSKTYNFEESLDVAVPFDEFFQDIPVICGGSLEVNTKALLAIKIRFGESPADFYLSKTNATCLGLRLKSEGFIKNPVKWMVMKGFVSNKSTCRICIGESVLKKNSKYTDGCSWLCQKKACGFENIFQRPKFFANFPVHSLSYIAGLIFHWCVQSDLKLIYTDVPLDCEKVYHVWESFQGLCSDALKRKKERIGGKGHIVEVCVVRYGKLLILGAMDRETKQTLIQSFPMEMEKTLNIYYTLCSWIFPKTRIVLDIARAIEWQEKQLNHEIVLPDTSVTDKSSPLPHVLNIKNYLMKHLSNMFGRFRDEEVKQEVMQSYLEELMWREQYGKEPQEAFVSIINEIFYYKTSEISPVAEREKKHACIPKKVKEIRVVLHKIPKYVLDYYGYQISSKNSFKNSESTSSSTALSNTQIVSTSSILPKNVEISNQGTVQRFVNQNLFNSGEMRILGNYFPSRNNLLKTSNSKNSEIKTVEESTSSSNGEITNKVQPLVIKMHKKRKKFESYLKSDFEVSKKMVLERTPSNSDISDTADLERQRTKGAESPETCSSDSWQSTVLDVISCDDSKGSACRTSKRRSVINMSKEGKHMCIECGESVSSHMDHFMKQFECADCETFVYTTTCSKAFFEHRSSLLFGKQMPRHGKDEYGLHRPITLSSPWFCACGFSSDQGNNLASHMLSCGKTTCYNQPYHAGSL